MKPLPDGGIHERTKGQEDSGNCAPAPVSYTHLIAFRTFYAGRSGVTELSEKTSKINGLQVVNKLYLQIIGVQKWTPIILFFLII